MLEINWDSTSLGGAVHQDTLLQCLIPGLHDTRFDAYVCMHDCSHNSALGHATESHTNFTVKEFL